MAQRDSAVFSIPLRGRETLAALVKDSTLHLAWGTLRDTDEKWTDNPSNPSVNDTKLIQEVGRRKVIVKSFVTKSETGEIHSGSSKWTTTSTPTRHLYLKVDNDVTDAADSTIYQIGLFSNTIAKSGKENNNWLLPEDILNPGMLLAISNIDPIVRNSSTRESRQFIITF